MLSLNSFADAPVKWGGYIDTYYAWDFNAPDSGERSYVATSNRHSEFNINLAHLEAKYDEDKIYGRLAFQTGTFVQNAYSLEANRGATSGPLLSRHIQEGYIGYRITPKITANMGIHFSHIGMESYVLQENWIYTHSMAIEWLPFYQSGAWATFDPNPKWSFKLYLLNGWQNIAENNKNKAIGSQLIFTPNDLFNFTYNNIYSEDPKGRLFQDFIWKFKWHPRFENALQIDVGRQSDGLGKKRQWWAFIYAQRVHLTEKWKIGTRLERYHDPYQLNVSTGSPRGFQVYGGSVNLDYFAKSNMAIRTEFRVLHSRDPIYPKNGNRMAITDNFIVESFSLKF